MKSQNTHVTSRNIKKGITAIVVGVLIAAGGVSMGVNAETPMMITSWVLDVFGVLLALSGLGYLAGILGRKEA